MSEKLIHDDCQDPAAEFEGYLNELVRQARHHPNQPVNDDHIAAILSRKADFVAEQVGGGS